MHAALTRELSHGNKKLRKHSQKCSAAYSREAYLLKILKSAGPLDFIYEMSSIAHE